MSFLLSLSTLVISETFDPEEIEILAVLLLAVYVAYNASREYRSRIQQLQLDQFSDVNEELGQSNAIEELGLPDVSEELGQSDVTEELGQSDASEELGQSDASEELGKSDASEELGQSDVSEELGLQHSPHATHFSRLCLGFRCFFRSVWDLAVLLVWMALLYGSLLLILLLIVLAITCSRQDANALRAFFNKQNWGVKPVHPLAENFPPACPPNYRFYPNYERVLGIPGPLYPDLHPPFSTVRKYYRQTMKCWHGDKRGNYPFLSNQQWHEIQRLVDDSYLKLTYTAHSGRLGCTRNRLRSTSPTALAR
ncbi:hypothetical protein CC80DRAFT_237370 [Byssothecium circinans]|uniref:Uncharacterized protein n=1 Tax=Byssothecium circinans TaxID=147558 RepID=A0A6A5U971_9PLEO|nr:hypothetical protein CC80DRAFT_237370 [Byssothecium circinans]